MKGGKRSVNRDEAKYILRVYRTSGEDASDPQFGEALQCVSQDPELARWFAEEQALDAQIAGKLRGFPVSPQIKNQLLAARKIIRPVSWWRKPARFAAVATAAAVLILAAVTTLWLVKREGPEAQVDFADFRRVMAKAALDMSRHVDVMGLSTEELQRWIVERGGIGDFVLPSGMSGFSVIGCKVLDWRGHKVTLLCFKPGGGRHFDVFVIHENDLPKGVVNATPEFASVDGLTTVAWRHNGKIYLLASAAAKTDLEKLL